MHSDDILDRLSRCDTPVALQTTPTRLFVLLCYLQLALRHPSSTGPDAAVARELAESIAATICRQLPEARALIDPGWQHPSPTFCPDVAAADYPLPDPCWDYAGIYHQMQAARKLLEQAITAISDLETATPESDRVIASELRLIAGLLAWPTMQYPRAAAEQA